MTGVLLVVEAQGVDLVLRPSVSIDCRPTSDWGHGDVNGRRRPSRHGVFGAHA